MFIELNKCSLRWSNRCLRLNYLAHITGLAYTEVICARRLICATLFYATVFHGVICTIAVCMVEPNSVVVSHSLSSAIRLRQRGNTSWIKINHNIHKHRHGPSSMKVARSLFFFFVFSLCHRVIVGLRQLGTKQNRDRGVDP